jgi:hypothetical protein
MRQFFDIASDVRCDIRRRHPRIWPDLFFSHARAALRALVRQVDDFRVANIGLMGANYA